MRLGGARRRWRGGGLVAAAAALVLALVRPAGAAEEAAPDAAAPDDLLVVVHTGAAVEAVSRADVAAVFLGRRTAWPSGAAAVPIHARAGTDLRAAFVRRVLGMEPEEEQAYAREERIRTGRRPPAEFAGPLRAVFALKDAVGYVFRRDFRPGTARVVLVVAAE